MTREEKRIAIAQACGWTEIHEFFNDNFEHPNDYRDEIRGKSPRGRVAELPDYFGSLDSMHEAERVLLRREDNSWNLYKLYLHRLALGNEIHAAAEQKAEAIGLALGLWKEGQ